MMRIPLSAPDISEPEIAAVAAVLRSPQLSLGPQLAAFEATFAGLTQVPHAIAVSSGTAGLHLAIRALELGEARSVLEVEGLTKHFPVKQGVFSRGKTLSVGG